jgi:hypothetical protein
VRQNHHTFQRIFSAPFEVNFGAFFGPLAFAILLVLLGFFGFETPVLALFRRVFERPFGG